MRRRQFLELAVAGVADWGAGAGVCRPLYARALAAPPRRLALYASGHITPALVAGLGASEFNLVILAFLYARYRRGALELRYNALPATHLPASLGAHLRRLRRGFPVRKAALISIGGWGNAPTFEAIRAAGVPRFLDQLEREIVAPLGLEGLDLDLEPGTVAENTPAGWHAVHDEYGATLIELTNGYMARHPSHLVTHAPIASVAAALYARDGHVRGIQGSIFEATRTARGNNIAWLNVQFYEAGDPKPESIPDFYQRELITPLWQQRARTDIARPWERVLPGFEPRYLMHNSGLGARAVLAECEATLAAINQVIAPRGPAGGAFLWQYGQIAHDVSAWGRGLRSALDRRA